MSSSVVANKLGADHRANSAAYYAADRRWQAFTMSKIRILLPRFINSGKLLHRHRHPSLLAAKTGRKLQVKKIWFFLAFVAVLHSLSDVSQVRAKNPPQNSNPPSAVDPQLSAKLLSDYRVSIHEKPLRDTVQSLADRAEVNLWLDREIDPTTLITTGTEARTLYQAISAAARSAGASVTVVNNVVLVGREDWVKRVAGAVLSNARGNDRRDIIWPDLTTPTDAAASCVTSNQQPLPHDLWPAAHLTKIDETLVLLLVAAQFDLMPSTESAGSYAKLIVPDTISAFYPLGKHASAMRAAISQADPSAKVKELNSQLLVTGSTAAHHAATTAWLGFEAAAAPKPLDIDKVRFSMDLKNAVAGQVFAQLSGAAGRVLVVDPKAVELCKQKVSLSAKDEPLRSISESVAKASGVTITWSDTELTVFTR